MASPWLASGQLIPASKIRSLTIEDGLPQGFVPFILQDRDGFMWFATNDGLARYDGREFAVFQHKENDPNSISTNVVGFMFTDSLNRLWLLHENRVVDQMDLQTGIVSHLDPVKMYAPVKGKDLSRSITRIGEFRGRIYYIYATNNESDNKICWYDWHSGSSGVVKLPPGETPLFLNPVESGAPFIRTKKTLYRISGPSEIEKIAELPEWLGGQLMGYYYAFGSHGELHLNRSGDVILNTHGGVWRLDHATRSWKYIQYPTEMVNKSWKQITLGPDGQIYLASQDKVYKLLQDGSLQVLWINNSKPNDVIYVTVDRTNIMWVSTNTFGLRKIDLNSSGFRSYPVKNKFAYDVVPEQAGIRVNNRYYNVMEKESFYLRSALDRNNDLWISNYIYDSIQGVKVWPNSFIRIRPGRADVVNVAGHPGYNGGFCFDKDNQCWAVDYRGELYRVNLQNPGWQLIDTIGLRVSPILSMSSNSEGLWVIYSGALGCYDPATRKTTIYRDQKGLEILRNANLLMATPDPDDDRILWLSSRGNGLLRFDSRNLTVKQFTTREGIPNNTVYSVIPDKKGFLWCSSNKGIFRFNRKDLSSISFTVKDGLQGNEFNRFQYLQFNNKIIFGGTEGYTVFDPDSVAVDKFQPVTKLTGLLVNNEPVDSLKGWNIQKITSTEKMVFNYDQNFLTFSFAALEFNAPEMLQYRYMLKGVDDDWINIGSRNTANYTNLSPGKYILKLNASNTAGIWSPKITSIEVTILPPWWQTWWAYALYIAVIAGLAISFFRFRLSQAKARQEMELKRKEAAQLKAMDEMKSRFFSNITHEFRTPLSLIISPLEQLVLDQETPSSVKQNLGIVQRNARHLLRLINQLLDMNKIEAGNMKASFSRGSLRDFIGELTGSFRPAAEAKKISLIFHSSLPDRDYLFDVDKLEKILYNLLSNALKFTHEGGRVEVDASIDGRGNLLTKVTDTGIGIAQDKQDQIFSRFFQIDNSATRKYEGTGIGLALVKELLDLLGGTISVQSTPGHGSVFSISLPIRPAGSEMVPRWISSIQTTRYTEIESPISGGPMEANDRPLIMVVEDNKELREFVAGVLKNSFNVMEAGNGREALALAQKELPALILSDVMMPEMDGFTLCREIKINKQTDHIAVVLLTAKAASASVIEGLSAGADDYIQKPFQIEELLLRIGNILSRQEKLRVYLQNQLSEPVVKTGDAMKEHPFLLQLYELIDRHLDDGNFSVELLAQEAAMSSKTLNRKLAALVGLSAGELIRQYRLKKSLEFLRAGSSISEAAYQAGFESHSHYSTSFKAFFGLTPSEFVARNSKN